MLRSGEIAIPMVSGLTLLLANMYGSEVSSRGGIRGAFLPQVPGEDLADFASIGPRNPP
jgi:hypothetical protein